jgi:hypothetical protein
MEFVDSLAHPSDEVPVVKAVLGAQHFARTIRQVNRRVGRQHTIQTFDRTNGGFGRELQN